MPSSSAHRQHDPGARVTAQVTAAAVAAQCVVQVLVARAVITDQWWRATLIRARLRVAHPAGTFTPLPRPGWQSWLPSAATAVLVTLALVALAMLLVRAGRGWWLLLVAALPLVPAQMAPGSWAPPPASVVAYALVWPAGAPSPSIGWAWINAAITALLVAIPAATMNAQPGRRPGTSGTQVLSRLAPAGVAAVLVLAWLAAARWSPDATATGWRVLLAAVGALLATGVLRRSVVVSALVVLPAVASGTASWAAGPDGVVVVAAQADAAWMSVAALVGAGAAVTAPLAARLVRRGWVAWRAMLAADVAAHNTARELARATAASERAGGRHRAARMAPVPAHAARERHAAKSAT